MQDALISKDAARLPSACLNPTVPDTTSDVISYRSLRARAAFACESFCYGCHSLLKRAAITFCQCSPASAICHCLHDRPTESSYESTILHIKSSSACASSFSRRSTSFLDSATSVANLVRSCSLRIRNLPWLRFDCPLSASET